MPVYDGLHHFNYMKELYWAAGFLEGEGCFQKKVSVVSASQLHREPLDRLQKLFGGNVRYQIRKNGSSNIWNWSVSSTRAIGVMMTLYSILSEKRRDTINTSLSIWKAKSRAGRCRDLRYCIRGHDISEVGVDLHGVCNSCRPLISRKSYEKMVNTVQKRTVCDKGHILAEVGMSIRGDCKECKRQYDVVYRGAKNANI